VNSRFAHSGQNGSSSRLMYEGRAYFFCTLTCAGEFARTPERFVEQSAR
jgi:YHS domain-containing protein